MNDRTIAFQEFLDGLTEAGIAHALVALEEGQLDMLDVPNQWKTVGWVPFRPVFHNHYTLDGGATINDFEVVTFFTAEFGAAASRLDLAGFCAYLAAVHVYLLTIKDTPLDGDNWDERERVAENTLLDAEPLAMSMITDLAFKGAR